MITIISAVSNFPQGVIQLSDFDEFFIGWLL